MRSHTAAGRLRYDDGDTAVCGGGAYDLYIGASPDGSLRPIEAIPPNRREVIVSHRTYRHNGRGPFHEYELRELLHPKSATAALCDQIGCNVSRLSLIHVALILYLDGVAFLW